MTTPYYERDGVTIHHGDCREVLATLRAESVHAVVTDPPYELGFMGKSWDSSGVAFDPETWRACLGVLKPGGWHLTFGGSRTVHRIAVAIEDAGFELRDTLLWLYGSGFPKSHQCLKPAFEPIVMARKPPEGSTAANVARHGCGALNIDACRVETDPRQMIAPRRAAGLDESRNAYGNGIGGSRGDGPTTLGRWPANLCHDGSDEVLDAFAAFGEKKPGGVVKRKGGAKRQVNCYGEFGQSSFARHGDEGTAHRFFYCTKARGDKARGEGNTHPTVKPTALMEWLVKLVAPPGGVVIDPFLGSGTTGVACARLGVAFVGIEQNEAYCEIAARRLDAELDARASRLFA